jgi:hypothetical protein
MAEFSDESTFLVSTCFTPNYEELSNTCVEYLIRTLEGIAVASTPSCLLLNLHYLRFLF